MKNYKLLFGILLFSISCSVSKNTSEYDYYYFSETAFKLKMQMSRGLTPVNFTSINGKEYTCLCRPEFVKEKYLPNFPDTKLVAKLKKGTGKVLIHY